MKTYLSVFRIRFANAIQYRAAAMAGVSTQFAWGFMQILAFSAFYKTSPDAFPMGFSQLSDYVWLQQAFLALFMLWFYDAEIFNSITDGAIAYELARPMGLYGRWFFHSAATRLARTALRCLPVLLVAIILPVPFGLSLPASWAAFVFFLLSLFLGLGVVLVFSMLVYISSLHTLSSYGNRLMAAILGDFLSGHIVPLPFFPEPFRTIAELLPFSAMANTPLRIYSGHISGSAMYSSLLLQCFWFLALLFWGKALMKNAIGKIVIQGG